MRYIYTLFFILYAGTLVAQNTTIQKVATIKEDTLDMIIDDWDCCRSVDVLKDTTIIPIIYSSLNYGIFSSPNDENKNAIFTVWISFDTIHSDSSNLIPLSIELFFMNIIDYVTREYYTARLYGDLSGDFVDFAISEEIFNDIKDQLLSMITSWKFIPQKGCQDCQKKGLPYHIQTALMER